MGTNERNVSLLITVLGVAAALVAMLTVGVFVQGWVLRQLEEEERAKVFERSYPELEAYAQEQEQLLSAGYYWVDQEAGVVHLPIERAMALVVEEAAEEAGGASGFDPVQASEEPGEAIQ